MSSSELESTDSPVSEDEEGKIYQLIYDLIPANDKEEKEDVQILCSSGDIPVPLKTDAERSVPPHTVAYNDTRALYLEEFNYFEEIPALNGDTESSAERPWRLSAYLYRRGPPALSSLDRGHSKGFDDPSTSKPCSSGVSYLIPRNMTLKAGVRETAKAWEFILRQEESENSRERSRKRGLAKGRRRVRDKNRGKCSSSHSGKERNEEERKHSYHSSERVSERPRESSHRDNSEGKKKSSR
ncbi:Sodium leak channel non-selective protein, partial [Dissostichus eleginoides]